MIKELKVDKVKCTQCRQCLQVCYTNVIDWDETAGGPVARYPLDCQLCCVCEDACPANAITVVPDWSLKYYAPYLSAAAIEVLKKEGKNYGE
ncbi:MAG: ferredoxin family protein [Enterococcus sp.]|nr:ferredoxin family protein [Enterococcus sp.]